MFYNQQNLRKKRENWTKIKQILKSMNFKLKDETINNIIYMDQKESLKFLIDLHRHLTFKKKILWQFEDNKENTPFYLQPTANFLMR